ncbi:hypothetical protein, partial [Microbacterium sp. CCH5-D1]|uniref:hypothetical protein n=1 Tax=Microbacterium sp. CCH5-D1 TaxID=1768780 RepID=UPI001E353B07
MPDAESIDNTRNGSAKLSDRPGLDIDALVPDGELIRIQFTPSGSAGVVEGDEEDVDVALAVGETRRDAA